MIVEIPNENSIVKYKMNDKDEWKVAEISDLIKAYERPQGEWVSMVFDNNTIVYCSECHTHYEYPFNYCPYCGAYMRGKEE